MKWKVKQKELVILGDDFNARIGTKEELYMSEEEKTSAVGNQNKMS